MDPAVQNGYDGPVTIVGATYEQFATEGETKASFNENGTFGWETAESAKFETTNGWYESTAQDISADKSKCSFQIVGDLSTDMVAVLPADINPARYDAQSTNDGLKVTIPASRTWVKDQSYATMLGFGANNGGNTSYSFSHLGGLAKIKVNGVPANATKFVFKTKGYKINGEFEAGKINTSGGQTISTATASPDATATDDFTEDEETYSLTFDQATISSNGNLMEFNVPLPCGNYTNGFAFCFKDNEGTVIYSFVGSSSQTVGRTDRLCLPTINIVGGGGENLPTKSVQNIPAGYKGDFLLAEAENVLLKIAPETNANDINLKYNSGQKPSNLEINIVDGETAGTFAGTISGILPDTHVDFTKGTIANVSMTTSTSTFEIIYPATISSKLTVTGGNVAIKGATVGAIEVAEGAKASEETQAPVQIVVESYTPTVGEKQEPTVTEGITAKANVVVAAPEDEVGVTVNVPTESQANVKVATEGINVTVNGVEETPATAKIGDIKYFTLADAVKAAPANATEATTITLLENVTDGAGIFLAAADKKKIVIDLNTKTYTAKEPAVGSSGTENQAFHLEKDNTVVIKNGTLTTTADPEKKAAFRFVIQNYASLTLEGVTVDGGNLGFADKTRYTVSNNCGTVEFKGATTIKAATTNGIAFDVCKYGNYDAPKVTWSSSGSVDGEIELTGGEFILGHNLEVNQPVRVKAAATLNLGTYTLCGSSDFSKKGRGVVIVNRDGDLTIKGTTGIIDGATNEINAAVVLTEPEACDINTENLGKSAKLTVEGGTLKGYYYGISGNGNSNRHNTVITIKGGTIQGYKSDDCVGIYHPQGGELIISGGEIKGSTGLVLKGGNLTITGGEIKGIGTADSFVHNGNGWHNTGDALAVEVCDYPGQPLTVNINGGVFTSTNGNAVASYVQPDKGYKALTGFIHGGTFSDEEVIKYAANGADINIALQANRNASGIFLGENKNVKVTFDLGGKTLNFKAPAVGSSGTENQAFHIEQGNQLFTLKNGKVTIDANAKGAFRFIIQNYNDLTVDGVELDGTNLAYNVNDKVRYTVSNNQGTVNFTGNTTIKAASENGIAFDVCKYASYDAPTVTWASSGSVTGEIEFSGGTFVLGHNLAVKQPIKVIAPATLDLADYTLSAADGFTRPTAGVIIVNRKGDLTVKGNTEGAIDAKQVYAAVLMTEKTVDTQDTTNPAKLTVESGSLLGLNYGVVGNGSTGRGNTVITVTGGKIKGTSTESAGIYHPQNGTLTIAGGEIEGSTGIYVKSGDVITSVSAGTIKGTGAKNDYKPCTNGFQSTGDAIVFDNCGYPGGEPNAKISGGTFISTNAAQIGNYGYLPTYKPITIDYTGYQGTKPTERTNIE